jgi:DNA-binding transcriptional LysR family regulator
MDRAQRLTGIWSWLPAFRVVAETEHLPTAARAMHVSASSLSRSVSLLEGAIGRPLFARTGRRIQLNPAGAVLLAAVRDAMRRIDDATSEGAPRLVRITGHAAWIGLLAAPAAAARGLELEDVAVAPPAIRAALLRGEIDLAITETAAVAAAASPELSIERLGPVHRALYRAPDHRPRAHAICTDGTDAWPPDLPRTVVLRAPRLDAVLELCAAGSALAVLPRALARPRGLRALRAPVQPPSQLYLVSRVPLGDSPLAPLCADIRDHARRALAAGARAGSAPG